MVFVPGRGLVDEPENPDSGMTVPDSRRVGHSNPNDNEDPSSANAFPSSADNPFPSGAVQDPTSQVPENVAADILAHDYD